MLELLKQGWFYYNKFWWVIGIAKNELMKPMTLWNETALIVLVLDKWGVNVGWQGIIGANVGAFAALFIAGLILIALGTVKTNSRLANTQNPEFMELMAAVKRVEGMVNEIKNDY